MQVFLWQLSQLRLYLHPTNFDRFYPGSFKNILSLRQKQNPYKYYKRYSNITLEIITYQFKIFWAEIRIWLGLALNFLQRWASQTRGISFTSLGLLILNMEDKYQRTQFGNFFSHSMSSSCVELGEALEASWQLLRDEWCERNLWPAVNCCRLKMSIIIM